jgi:hypothetical protein
MHMNIYLYMHIHKIDRFYHAIISFIGTILVQGLTYLIFGCSNVLFHLYSYVILFNSTVGPPVALICVLTVSRISQTPRTYKTANYNEDVDSRHISGPRKSASNDEGNSISAMRPDIRVTGKVCAV